MKSTLGTGFADWLGETRVFGEFLSFAIYGLLHRTLPNARSHGRGVLLIPGFLSGDLSLSPLADRLRQIGYAVFFSGIWYNVDCPFHTMPRLEKVLRKAHRKTGSKVILIGHSLGGIYARELACRFPNLVERVILLGAPVKDPIESSNNFLRPLFELAHRRCAESLTASSQAAEAEMSPGPPRVPETLIYSKTDGIVNWQNCVEFGPRVEAIEVPSSHCGLPYSMKVFGIIIDRLARCAERSRLLTPKTAVRKYGPLGRLRTAFTSVQRSRRRGAGSIAAGNVRRMDRA